MWSGCPHRAFSSWRSWKRRCWRGCWRAPPLSHAASAAHARTRLQSCSAHRRRVSSPASGNPLFANYRARFGPVDPAAHGASTPCSRPEHPGRKGDGAAAQQSCSAEHQRVGADADDGTRPRGDSAQKRERLLILEHRVDPSPARNEDQVEAWVRRRLPSPGSWAVLGAHRNPASSITVGSRFRQSGENLVGTG
jgi:hypothetical protein